VRDIIAGDGEALPKHLLCFIDAGVHRCHPHLCADVINYCRHHGASLSLCAYPSVVPGGEEVKNDPAAVVWVQKAIREAGLCRHSYVLAVGGGSVIDMVGYAAATAHRGMRLVRIPTTVLAQDDAALGVKNGINALGRKNFCGTFAPPWAVINDACFLTSLSDRDWISGTAEAVKIALIKDADFFDFIERHADALRNRDGELMKQLIHRCASLHLQHIASCGDPFEAGNSRPLDFGHWSAHKLEQISGYRLRHGEAVAVGMAVDATYSLLAGLLGERQWRRIMQTLGRLGFTLPVPELAQTDRLRRGLKEFQEHLGGDLSVMLLSDIGEGREVHTMDEGLIVRALTRIQEKDREDGDEDRQQWPFPADLLYQNTSGNGLA
jgi:3-dehydroquinate synthase